jgi:FkbH-like protein
MKLLEALSIGQRVAQLGGEPFRIYLACGFQPLHLPSFLIAHLHPLLGDRRITVEVGVYGDISGNIERLSESGALSGVVILEWADLDPRLGLRALGGWGRSELPDILAASSAQLSRLLALLTAAARRMPVALSLPTLPLPPISPLSAARASSFALELEERLAAFAVSAARVARLSIVDRRHLAAVSLLAERLDIKSEFSAGFPYRLPHASHLAASIAELLCPAPAKKGLVTDLDNTLWRGVLGEDGVSSVSWDLDHKSHIHALYQQLLKALAQEGTLLAVASKNDPALGQEALSREDLLLPKDSLYPVEISWGDKSRALARILDAWNVGPDSVVFVDDSPHELAEVQAAHPQVLCLLFPQGNDEAAYQLLVRLRAMFGKERVTEEDALRQGSLRRDQEVRAARASGPEANEAFLAQLSAEVTMAMNPDPEDRRPLDLINKTNQWNLNGRRLTEGEYQALRGREGAFVLAVSYSDKHGPLGKIAVLLGLRSEAGLAVDLWVMSCRAFSRRIEHRCIEYLFEKFDVPEISFRLQPTERNGPLLDFFAEIRGGRPAGPVKIGREEFFANLPAMAHRIKETPP